MFISCFNFKTNSYDYLNYCVSLLVVATKGKIISSSKIIFAIMSNLCDFLALKTEKNPAAC